MANRRDQIRMTPEEVAAYLDEQRTLNVATVRADGFPHLVAMWFVVQDGVPTFWTFAKSQKVMNIRRDPKITALVESGERYDQLRGVQLIGTARLVDDPAQVLEIGRQVALRYNGPAAVDGDGLRFLEKQASKRIGVAIDVHETISWDHTKISGY